MNLLLLYPNLHGMNMLPTAMALFAALARRDGHKVELFDTTNWVVPGETEFDSDKEKEKLLTARPYDDSILRSQLRESEDVFQALNARIRTFRPDLIAASVPEDLFPVCLKLLESVAHFRIPTILGGVFPTFAPEKCLERPEVDMVCIGEGERPLLELCRRMDKGLSWEDIPGLWVKTPGGVVKNPLGPPADIDDNPLPDLSLFDESCLYRPMQGRVWRMLPVETHRGCPYSCAYCNSPVQRGMYRELADSRHYRKKSFEAIQRELVHLKDTWKAEALYFWADSFLTYTDREFARFVEIYQDIRLPFWCQSRPETIREDRIRTLMDLGLFRMSFGVEHGNEEFRRRVLKRNVSNKAMLEGFGVLDKLGLKYSVNNIIGFPTETRELAMDTVEINRHIKADSANAYSFSPFHGTPLRAMAEELGYCSRDLIARSLMKPTLLDMPGFPAEAIEGLRRCFTFYVKMPKSRWPEIKKAESLTPEGDAMWEALRAECLELYFTEART